MNKPRLVFSLAKKKEPIFHSLAFDMATVLPPPLPTSSPAELDNVDEWHAYARAALVYALMVSDTEPTLAGANRFVNDLEHDTVMSCLAVPTDELAATVLTYALNRPVAPPLIVTAMGSNPIGAAMIAFALLKAVTKCDLSIELKGQLSPPAALEALARHVMDGRTDDVAEAAFQAMMRS